MIRRAPLMGETQESIPLHILRSYGTFSKLCQHLDLSILMDLCQSSRNCRRESSTVLLKFLSQLWNLGFQSRELLHSANMGFLESQTIAITSSQVLGRETAKKKKNLPPSWLTAPSLPEASHNLPSVSCSPLSDVPARCCGSISFQKILFLMGSSPWNSQEVIELN